MEKEEHRSRRRPVGVILIAAVQAINALTLAIHFALVESDPQMPVQVEGDPGIIASFFVVLGVVTALGLWLLQRWAWVATMLWAGFTMAAGLWAYAEGSPVSYPVMALTLLQVFYLNLSDVQAAFERGRSGQQTAHG